MNETTHKVTAIPKITHIDISVGVCHNLSLNIPNHEKNDLSSIRSWFITLCISLLNELIYCACFHDSYLTLAASYHIKRENIPTTIDMVLKNHSKRITIIKTLLVNVLCADGIPHEDHRERSVNLLQQ
jgi:hypothetical protein